MPRNDQVTRQWHLLQRLTGARQGLTLAQLVDAIPPDLTRHPRTVRRDLAALEASHFPLLTERVDGEVRWSLLDGFKNIPSLRLSPTELMALAFSRQLLTPLQGTLIAAALNSALTKINAAIPAGAPITCSGSTSGSRSGLARTRTIGTIARPSTSSHRPLPIAGPSKCAIFLRDGTRRTGGKWIRIACAMWTEVCI